MAIWDFSNFVNNTSSTDGVVNLIKESAVELSNFSKGMVLAEFDSLDTIPGSITIMAKTITESFVGEKDILSYPNSDKLQDANTLYKGIDYGFELHNDLYKYRVFDIRIMPVFPVIVKLDEDIIEDEMYKFKEHALFFNDTGLFDIYNENDFKIFLVIVLNSRKVMTILKSLLDSNNNSDQCDPE